jgi:hypothetical protein
MADIARIKANIQSMIDQGAPDEDIDAYLADEGVTTEMLQGPAEGTDEKSFFQKVLDLTNAQTGESYLYGNNPKPDAFSDVTRIMADTATRGFGDKTTGTGNLTDAARERTPGYVEAPADITAALASSPYRVGSTIGGGIAGGLEGAASAYGHQEGWMPDLPNMAKEGLRGAAIGSGAAKAGEWAGKGFNWLRGKPAISTADELLEAGEKAGKKKRPNMKERDILARTKRMKAAEIAQTEGPGGFKKILEGIDAPETEVEKVFGNERIKWPHAEHKDVVKLANPPPASVGRISRTVGSVLEGGGGLGKLFAGPLNMLAPIPKHFAERAKTAYDNSNFDDLTRNIVDSTGRLKTDKKTINMMRDALARAAPRTNDQRNRGAR